VLENMPADSRPPAAKKPEARARVSNGKVLFADCDGRSVAARRFRDLLDDLARDFGGRAALNTGELSIIRQCAALTVRAEALQVGAGARRAGGQRRARAVCERQRAAAGEPAPSPR